MQWLRRLPIIRNAGCIFVSAVLTFSSAVVSAQCMSAARVFVKHPDEQTYRGMVDAADDHIREDCRHVFLKPVLSETLLRSVESGNPWSIKVLADLLFFHLLDGGDLEDAHRALGVSAEKNPRVLLRLYAEKRISSYGLARSVIMLPLSLVDNLEGQQSRLIERSRIISAIAEPDLKEARNIALAALTDAIKRHSRQKEKGFGVRHPKFEN